MIFRRKGMHRSLNTQSVLDYLDSAIKDAKIGYLESLSENNITKRLWYGGAKTALEAMRKDILRAIEEDET